MSRFKNDFKLIVLVLAAFLLTTLASNFFVSQVVRRQIDLYSRAEMQVYRNSLTALNRASEDALRHAAMVMSIALDRGIKAEGHLDLIRRLTRAFSTRGNLKAVFFSAFAYLDGNLVTADGVTPLPEETLLSQAWYAAAADPGGRTPGEPVVRQTDPYLEPEANRAAVAMSLPIFNGAGEFRGVMCMEFLLAPVAARVEALKPQIGSFIALLADARMRLLAYPDRAMVGRDMGELPGLGPVMGELANLTEAPLVVAVEIEGLKFAGIFSRLENGWILGTLSPVDYYYGQAAGTLPMILAVALVSAAVLSVVLLRLSRQRDRSDAANRLKTYSLARISHELRTPLNAVIGLSELARRDPGAPKSLEHLEEISRAGGTLLGLVNEILDFAKMESGKFELTDSPYRPGRLISDILAVASVRLRDKPALEFRSDVSPAIPRELLGDEKNVRQTVLNLLVNAVKYTVRGKVRFKASCEAVDESSVILRFTVSDTGPGIRPEDMEHLFDDFVRLGGAKNRQVEGTGLGLSIARSLCRLMGGDVTVESVLGRGSTFTAACRQTVVDPRPMGVLPGRPRAAKKPAPVPFLAPGYKALVVDDVLTNLTVARGLLEPYGMEVTAAGGGAEAVRLAENASFDILFVDQMMPELDGVETLRRLRSLGGRYLRATVVALTANAVSGARESLLDEGFDDYMAKPVDPVELSNLLDRWVPAEARSPVPRAAGAAPSDLRAAAPSTPPSSPSRPGLSASFVPGGAGNDGVVGAGPADDFFGSDYSTLSEADFLEALDFEGFEPMTGLRRSGGSVGKYQEILSAFLLDADTFSARLREPGGPGDLADLGMVAHALKSASANVGAARLSHRAGALEAAAKNGDMRPFLGGEMALFQSDLTQVKNLVGEALRLSDEEEGPGRAPPAEELDSLRRALSGGDIGLADRLVDELSSACDRRTRAVLAAVSDQILVSDYAAALDLIGRI
ncbi:MAG: response regulator [Deltaproteobacteria bacterium]|nr:response regulator [Deltaproteobacteria bacterium]